MVCVICDLLSFLSGLSPLIHFQSHTDDDQSTNSLWEIPTYKGGPFHVGQFGATVEVAEKVLSFCPFAHNEKTFVDLTGEWEGIINIRTTFW